MRRQINPDELNYLYLKIGEAIWHLQYVENALVPFIIIKGIAIELNSLEETEALEHKRKLKKLTLGQLIGRAHKLNLLDEELSNKLKTFNQERKWLVHNSIFESGDELYTDHGRDNVFQKIENFIKEARMLHGHINESIVDYCVNKGMSREEINRIAQNQISKLKGDA